MKAYNVKTRLKKHGERIWDRCEKVMILSDEDDLDEFVQMTYGCWYEIISFDSEEIQVGISKTYLREEVIRTFNSLI